YSARIASGPAACSRQLGTVASSVASALHTSQVGIVALSIACRNFSITGVGTIVASLGSDHGYRARAGLQPGCSFRRSLPPLADGVDQSVPRRWPVQAGAGRGS